MAVVVMSPNALGNARPLATVGRKDSAPLSQSVVELQRQIDALRRTLQAVVDALNALVIPTPTPPFSVTLQDVPLVTATTTNIVPVSTSPANGDVLFVVTTQDATGGGLISWDASFKGVTPDDNDPITPNVLSSYLFIGRGGFWTVAALPKIGFAP